MMPLVYALASALFAALTTVLAKLGLEGINSTLATAIRTVVILFMSWAMVYIVGVQSGIGALTHRNWIYLILSGIATGASWLCYFKALQSGVASQVVAIDKCSIVLTMILCALVLGEGFSFKMILGTICITIGTCIMIF